MSSVEDHYESLLADHYTWLHAEDFEQKVHEQTELLQRAGASNPTVALDLGCGSGFQTLALHALGAKRVLAVDTSARATA